MTTASNDEKQAATPTCRRGGWRLAFGILLILARLITPSIPGLYYRVSLNTMQGVCHSGLGVLAGAYSHAMQSGCSGADTIMTVLNLLAVAGLALAVWGGVLLYRGPYPVRRWAGPSELS